MYKEWSPKKLEGRGIFVAEFLGEKKNRRSSRLVFFSFGKSSKIEVLFQEKVCI